MQTSSKLFVDRLHELVDASQSHGAFGRQGVVLEILEGEDSESEEEEKEEEEEEEEMDEETRDRMIQGNRPPRRNMCGGCGCAQSLCSSCRGD